MSVWIVEPRDTLVLRDGRPMEGTGLQLDSLPLPYPGALAGFMRTRSACDEQGRFRFEGDEQACRELLSHPVLGPWLMQIDPRGKASHMLPRPLDAILFKDGEQSHLHRLGLLPGALMEGEKSNIPDGLTPVFLGRAAPGKPAPLPAFWNWETWKSWLSDPSSCVGRRNVHELEDMGCDAGPLEVRTHVRIDNKTQTAEDSMLFSLGHRRFSAAKERKLSGTSRLALGVRASLDGLTAGSFPFAGERRLVHLRQAGPEEGVPSMPEDIKRKIVETGRARMFLGTPAIFSAGYRPGWILSQDPDVKVTLVAAVTSQPQSISGWDLHRRCPKPARRAVPAGAVYFLKLNGSPTAVEQYLERHWWQAVSDEEQDRRDGFGLAVFGVDEDLRKEGHRVSTNN